MTTHDAAPDSKPAARRPGRPRSAQADRAILQATLELFGKYGYEGMSIEGVAAQAGVGKTTIYRRWPSKDELLLAALGHIQSEVPVLDTGDLRADLITMTTGALDFFAGTETSFGPILIRALGESKNNPAVYAALRESVFAPRMGRFVARIQRAVARGELRDGIDLRIFIEILAGPIFFHSILSDEMLPTTTDYAERLIDTILLGLAPR